MTEEIIIDGVNVSECYADNKMMKDGLYCFWEGGNCEDNKYCYYKECTRLEQKNKDFEKLAKSLYKRIEELEKENEALAFRERLYKADYEASEQENNSLQAQVNNITVQSNNAITALEQENKELNFKINQLKANGLYNDLTGIELCAKVVELEQENKEEKKAYNECMHYLACMTEQRNKLKTALEEIRTYLDTLSSIDSDFTNTETYLRIQDKINEVLGNEKVSD